MGMLESLDRQEQQRAEAKAHVLAVLGAMPAGDHNEAGDHIDADRAIVGFLRGVGYADVADAYEAARDRVGFWYE